MVTTHWESLLETAQGISPLLHGSVRNFLLQVEGPVQTNGYVAWVRAFVQTSEQDKVPVRVALKIRASDVPMVQHCSGLLKAIQAKFMDEAPWPILDVAGPDSVLVSIIRLEQGEHIRVAEIFSGGFSGWSQAVTLLYDSQVPVSMGWTLDWDPQVVKYLQTQHPSLTVVTSPHELEEVSPETAVHLQVDAYDMWWLRMQSRQPASLFTISSPCPSWSTAASGRGLQTAEGGLLLHMAGVCAALEIPLVLIEQVEGFGRHPDYGSVVSAWERAGYVQRWCNTLDLLDFLPASRRRYLAILQHKSCALSVLPIPGEAWTPGRRMTLAQADVLFPLPAPIRKPLIPAPETLDMYLDPALLPGAKAPGRRQPPAAFRLRNANMTATCFMARYGSQHCLPVELLSTKGLMGCLYASSEGIRFFSSAEISSMHGMHEALWIGPDQSLNFQVAGNAIAVPHALAAFGFVLRSLGLAQGRPIASIVALCHARRITATNSAFLPVDAGWVLCRIDNLQSHLLTTLPKASFSVPLAGQATSKQVFEAPGARLNVIADAYASPQAVAAHLGLTVLHEPSSPAEMVSVTDMPRLLAAGTYANSSHTRHISVLSAEDHYVISAHSPLTCLQVLEACQTSACLGTTCALYSVEGSRVPDIFCLPRVCLAVPVLPGQPTLELSLTLLQVQQLRVDCSENLFRWHVPASQGDLIRLTFPFHLLRPLSWQACVVVACEQRPGPAYRSAAITVTLTPLLPQPRLSPPELRLLQALWLFRAQVLALADTAGPVCRVEVQVIHQAVWRGPLLCGLLWKS